MHRNTLGPPTAIAIILAAAAGMLFYHFSPTDLERAEADIQRAWVIMKAMEDEGEQEGDEATGHKARAAQHQMTVGENTETADTEWLEWQKAAARRHSQLRAAKLARRDNVLHVSAEYRRRITEAEIEVLRARDARDRGMPYKVAPRVRELLAPVLAAR